MKIASSAGLLACWEHDDALRLTDLVGNVLSDIGTGKNELHGMTEQFRQSVCGRLGGIDDAKAADPAYRTRI